MAGVAVGSVVGPPLVRVAGIRGAAAAIGLFLAGVVLLSWRRLVSIDRAVEAPAQELDAIEKVPSSGVSRWWRRSVSPAA